MTAANTILSAKLDAATLLGRLYRLGPLVAGKHADIIAAASSQLDDVTQLESARFGMCHGVVHTLDGVLQAFPAE